jgi:hypothetical protein
MASAPVRRYGSCRGVLKWRRRASATPTPADTAREGAAPMYTSALPFTMDVVATRDSMRSEKMGFSTARRRR